uniref:RNA binding motif protein 25b n=1 Tax=Cyprinus carpio carpio TaxID=630221 RepID=A0A9J7XP04_CYPCA
MSFPPHLNRPQIGIPTMPPGIPPPQFAGFPPSMPPGTPMIPVHMGIMTPGPAVLVPTAMPVISKVAAPRKESAALAKDSHDSSGPTTTVFVGNISEKASDMLIRQLLAKCGLVLSWKRVQGASGKLQAFGFCEYKEPESTLRSLRLLHELQIGEKKLLVKVDAKTKAQLDEWKAKKKSTSENGNGKAEDGAGEEEEEVLDEETKKRDQIVKGAIDGLIREYSSELNATSQDDESSRRKKRREKKDEDDISAMEMEDDKRDLISREINKFRDTHKKLEEEKGKREKERQELERERKERDKERERERERRDREREKDREREQRERERERERDRDRERTKEREREIERSRDRSEDRSRSRYTRQYLFKLLNVCLWFSQAKEGKRLKEFLEDYDDDRDDPKYYRGSALQKRLRDREKETELDERDRKREKEELEEIRQRLLAEGHPDPDAELRRMEEEAERLRQPPLKPEPEEEREHKPSREEVDRGRERDRRKAHAHAHAHAQAHVHAHAPVPSDDDVEEGEELEDPEEVKPCLKPTMRPITAAPSVSSASGNASPNTPREESPCGIIIPHENSPPEVPLQEENRPKIGLSLKLGPTGSPGQPSVAKRKKLAAESVFNRFDDDEVDEAPRKRKLVPLDYEDEEKGVDMSVAAGGKGVNTEEKRKHIKSLIEKIPTAKPELFNYPLDWSVVDTTLMEKRIRPWINKKIVEYIGEEEATLVDFVCSKVMAHGTPQGILDDVAMVLDEEAEVFIVKMWRLLIYETEAKKIGLGK